MAKQTKPKASDVPFAAVDWPALKAEMRDLKTLRPHPKNPKTHPSSQVEGLGKAMFEEFGVTSIIVADERGFILAGHGRVEAAQARGVKELPVAVVKGWTEDKKLAFMLSDNRWGDLSGYDEELRRKVLAELVGTGFDVDVAGYNDSALAELLAEPNAGKTDPDDAPAAKPDPVVRLGDVWTLGQHRLVCGDSTKKETVAAALAGIKPNLCVTDAPYGVDYDPAWRNDALAAGPGKRGAPGGRAVGRVANDDRSDWREAWRLFPGNVIYAWHGGMHSAAVQDGLLRSGFVVRAQIIWVKVRPVIGRGDYHWQHEPLFVASKDGKPDSWQERFDEEHAVASYAVRENRTHAWVGGRRQSTVWTIEHIKSETGHSTQKPVECMRRPLLNNSKRGDWVYDPFVGSGTAIIACEMEGRRCAAVEIEPAYAQVCLERWEAFTGKRATLDGKTIEQVTEARRVVRPTKRAQFVRQPVKRRLGRRGRA